MNRLPKEKRDKLILVCMVTGMALFGIGFGMIRPQYASIRDVKAQTNAEREKLQEMKRAITNEDAVLNQLQDMSDTLTQSEGDMANGDPNGWIYDTIRKFKSQYKMDVSIASPTAIQDEDMLPNFPFKQLKVTVNGTAFYHDLGKFIANFENDYPHGRICNLSITPTGGSGDNAEKLYFKMDIIVLVKPSES
jgi:Tfp pilus assembly protein PilO